MDEKIVVTGGAGFIGSTLVEALLEKHGFEVTVFDNFSTGYLENLASVKNKINIVKGDIRDYNQTEKALSHAKTVFHMAALSYVGESIKKPAEYNSVNIDGTLNVLKASLANSVERLVFPSTCVVYGETKRIPIPETEPLNPNTPYGLTKQAGEFYCKFFTKVHGLDTICLRIFNAYGPRMQNRVLSIFARLMLEDKQPTVSGNGKQSRDFVFIDDIVSALLAAMNANKRQSGKAFNVGAGKETNLNELINKINSVLGKNIKPHYSKTATGEINAIVADTSTAKKELGFTAKTNLNEGLKETIEWIKRDRLRRG